MKKVIGVYLNMKKKKTLQLYHIMEVFFCIWLEKKPGVYDTDISMKSDMYDPKKQYFTLTKDRQINTA